MPNHEAREATDPQSNVSKAEKKRAKKARQRAARAQAAAQTAEVGCQSTTLERPSYLPYRLNCMCVCLTLLSATIHWQSGILQSCR